MPLLRRLEDAVQTTRVSTLGAAVGVIACVALATLARFAVAPLLGDTLWFPTYYPAALLGTLFFGWRAGLLLMFASALAADFFFMPPKFALSTEPRDMAGIAVFLFADGVIVLAAGMLRSALLRLGSAHQREQVLNAELQHRLKNTLAVMQGLIRQSARSADGDAKDVFRGLEDRIVALGRAHDLLAIGGWISCELLELVEQVLEPFNQAGRIRFEGRACQLRPEACVPLVLALHELATNAVKYGALSVPAGRVHLSWTSDGQAPQRLMMIWKESGGPAVTQPTRRGLGSRLLSTRAGGISIDLRFAAAGVECVMEVDLAEVQASAGSTPDGLEMTADGVVTA